MARPKIKSFVYDGKSFEGENCTITVVPQVTIYYQDGATDWLAEDNAGMTWHRGTYDLRDSVIDTQATDAEINAAGEADDEISEIVARDGGNLAQHVGTAAGKDMVCLAWIAEDQLDGGWLLQ